MTAELQRLREENAQLRQALVSRPVIDQARGMIMAMGGARWQKRGTC